MPISGVILPYYQAVARSPRTPADGPRLIAGPPRRRRVLHLRKTAMQMKMSLEAAFLLLLVIPGCVLLAVMANVAAGFARRRFLGSFRIPRDPATPTDPARMLAGLGKADRMRLWEFVREGQQTEAMKLLLIQYGTGVKEARSLVDALANEISPPAGPPHSAGADPPP